MSFCPAEAETKTREPATMGCDSAGARTRMSKDEEESVLRMKFLFSWCPEESKTRSQMTEGQAEWEEVGYRQPTLQSFPNASPFRTT